MFENVLLVDNIVFIFETLCNGTFVGTIFGILTDVTEDFDIVEVVLGRVVAVWLTVVGAKRIGPIGARLANVPILSVMPFSALILV